MTFYSISFGVGVVDNDVKVENDMMEEVESEERQPLSSFVRVVRARQDGFSSFAHMCPNG
eukprot:scaffold473_cov132-Cylindrotheca_fusiformis.AAC.14